MRLGFVLLLLLTTQIIIAQQLKTIYTNENQVVSLFFPNTIRQAVVGSDRFTFSHNKENLQNIGLLQGISGKNSNLLVITSNGRIYSYILAYKKALDSINYFVKMDESIGEENPFKSSPAKIFSLKTSEEKVSFESNIDTIKTRESYFYRFSSYHLEHNQNSIKRKRKNGLVLHLKDLIYDRTEVYAVLEIKNKSVIDFDVNYLKIFKVNGNNRRKASYQKQQLKPLYTVNLPNSVKKGTKQFFVIVFPKFTMGDSEKLYFELNEENGSREIGLVVKPGRLR